MDHAFHGRPPTRRKALGDATLRANEDRRARSPRHGDKLSPHTQPSSSPKPLPHNESLVPNGTLAVRQQPQPSPQHKRVSAVINDECRPHNPKRDSEISNASTTASSRRKSHIGPWQLGKTIGKGGCSRVRIVRHSKTGQYGAAKIISKEMADRVRALSLANLVESAEYDPTLFPGGKVIPFGLEREICIMKLLDHQNIVRLYDIWENRNELYLIMEYVEGGELFSYMSEQGALPEYQVVHIFRQIIAALGYCHRINIHHRDLKPENILLDRDNLQIKLVDFGMAALQPQGKKLTTPCGSPHYAAPEVIGTKPYDGARADIWSCGVILYVLLTGTPPFNYSGEERHLRHLFRAITSASYHMPEDLSPEAQHLIRHILIANPKQRMSIQEIWEHPFLRKYDREFGYTRENTSLEQWIGPRLKLDDWKPLTQLTVDREILRYMRTLWHSEKEERLVRRLINNEANDEKYFYAALQKYQHDQLENYVPQPESVLHYSNSDHHHRGRLPPTSGDTLQLPSKQHKRSQSGYSILNDEHLYSKHSFYEHPSSDGSYDPFRASREPVIPNQGVHHNITVHRGPSSGSRKLRPATALGHRTGSSLRVQALRNSNSKRSSAMSRVSSKRSTPPRRSTSLRRTSTSRSSMASSRWPSSPPVIVRPASTARRGVSFSHLRRSSGVTVSTTEGSTVQYTPEQRRYLSRCRDSIGSSMLSPRPSTSDSPTVRPLPKIAASPIVPRLRIRKPESPSKYIQSEARKVSAELGLVMEEAFNRSSISSSIRTSTTEPLKGASECDTPPTLFSNRDSGATAVETPDKKATFQNRPLPPIPNETPKSFVHRTLAEARAEIARKLGENNDGTQQFHKLLEQLDLLMLPPTDVGKRTASAPAKSPEHIAPLQVIPEEAKVDGEERFGHSIDTYRSFTEPYSPMLQGRRTVTEQTTIRLVDQSPIRNAPAPLNIRKRSGVSTPTRDGQEGTVTKKQATDYGVFAARTNQPTPSITISGGVEKKEATIKKKKSSWFRRNFEEKERIEENPPKPKPAPTLLHIPEKWQDLDDRIKNDAPRLTGPSPDPGRQSAKQSDGSFSSEFPMRNCGTALGKSEGGGALKGFLGLFGKKPKAENKRLFELAADNLSASSVLSEFELEHDSPLDGLTRSGPEYQTNWLSRFLHIKPASKVLCFHLGRGKVRERLVRLLRSCQEFGIRDVAYDRERNVINARLDKDNRKKIKPVSFIIELFAVLHHGKRVGLTVARFTQIRGAASSFREITNAIEEIYHDEGMLVENEERKAGMVGTLSQRPC